MQTKEQLKGKVLEMIPQIVVGMTKNLDKVLDNIECAVNLEKYDNDYILPKGIVRALLKEEMFQYHIFINGRASNEIIDKLYALI